MTAPAPWRFEAVGAAARLREAGDALDVILASHGASERSRMAARLVAEEIVLNALEHGGATTVTLDVDPSDDPLLLVFEDDGAPFDPTAASRPRDAERPGELSTRGRGLILVHGLTRRIEHRRAAGRNRLSALLVE